MRALSLGTPATTIAFARAEQAQRASTGIPVERFVDVAETLPARFGENANGSSEVHS